MKHVGIKIVATLSIITILSSCGAETAVEEKEIIPAQAVRTQTVSQSKVLKQIISYPGMIVSDQDVKIVAKSSGTAEGVNFEVGSSVQAGQALIRINDGAGSGANTNQIAQANLAIRQAENALKLAKSNYNDILETSQKDLKSAEIAKNNAISSSKNIDTVSSMSYKSAELALENAKTALEQAKISLENKKILAVQAESDANTNGINASLTVASSIITVVNGLNDLFAFDERLPVSITYKDALGQLNGQTYSDAKNGYFDARRSYDGYNKRDFSDTKSRIDTLLSAVTLSKKAVNSAVTMMENTSSNSSLPLTSATGTSVSSIRTTLAGYLTTLNSSLTQLNSAKQAIENTAINNSTTISSLEKAVEIAQKQVNIAEQNVNNTLANSTVQKDQNGYSVEARDNDYLNIKLKLDTQISASRTAVTQAQIQYDNAKLTLQTLLDNHTITSPIAGTVSTKNISEGSSVSIGQVIATVTQTSQVKIPFYVDEDRIGFIKQGEEISVEDNNSNRFLAIITNISPQADPVSKRFLVEAHPKMNSESLLTGSLVTVFVPMELGTTQDGNIYLPLESLSITENEKSLFVAFNGHAKKIPIDIVKIDGEHAIVKKSGESSFKDETQIIIEGNKLLQDGDAIEIQK